MYNKNRTIVLILTVIILSVLFTLMNRNELVADLQTRTGGVDDTLADISVPVTYIANLNLESRELTPEIMKQYPNGKFGPRKIHNEAWTIGERLEFELTYSFYTAGSATMTVLDVVPVNGGQCYLIQTTAQSNEFVSTFYEVRDTVNSYIDTVGIFSRRLEKKLREGRYKADRYVDFYPDRLIALNTREKHALTEIPLYVQDILSSLYFVRTFDLEVGRNIEVATYADGKVYPLKVLIHKRENITVPAGTFTCLKIEPVLESEGIFRQKGKLVLWITDDMYKIPVKMESKVIIGSIASKLVSYQTGVTR